MSELIKELRIGNLLMYSDNSGIWEVSGIHEFGVDCFDYIEETYMEYENFEPIPLTEEWLINLGFEYYKVLSHYRIVLEDVWYQVKINEEGKFLFSFTNLNYDEANHMPPKFIKYVHQLQNLYFALAGNELPTANL